MKIFRNSLFELSSHHCGNFVVQALISHASNQGQVFFLLLEPCGVLALIALIMSYGTFYPFNV